MCLRVSWTNSQVLFHQGITTRTQRIPLQYLYSATPPCPGLLKFLFRDETVKASSFVNLERVHRKGKERPHSSQFLLESQHRFIHNSFILNRFMNKKPAMENSISHSLRHYNLPIDYPTSTCNCKTSPLKLCRWLLFVLQVHPALFPGSRQISLKKRSPESPVALTAFSRALQCCEAFLRLPSHICYLRPPILFQAY